MKTSGVDEYKVMDPARREYHKDVSGKVNGCLSLQSEISPFNWKATKSLKRGRIRD